MFQATVERGKEKKKKRVRYSGENKNPCEFL